MPWQILRRPVPEKLTGGMVREAAKVPDETRALIEKEGLRNLGFSPQDTQSAHMAYIVRPLVQARA